MDINGNCIASLSWCHQAVKEASVCRWHRCCPPHGHSKHRSGILCQWTVAFLFYFPWEPTKVSTDRVEVVDAWRATLLSLSDWSFLRFLSKTPSKMSTSSPEAVKKLVENMQTDLRSLSMECKKKFPPVKEVSLLVSYMKQLPKSSGWFRIPII